jgi:hypothetical protein
MARGGDKVVVVGEDLSAESGTVAAGSAIAFECTASAAVFVDGT